MAYFLDVVKLGVQVFLWSAVSYNKQTVGYLVLEYRKGENERLKVQNQSVLVDTKKYDDVN
ncbi:hypothetical protein ACERJO_14475 [Halalkalibacter sp. AB-rgal2]|nr:hypothetical protein [Halalkalibacter sp. APA_J-10(15)]